MEKKIIAIITSSGGSIFRSTLDILKKHNNHVEFVMISDRKCRAEKIAEENNFPLHRIEEKENQKFSIKCKEVLDRYPRIDAVFTFITRLITKELVRYYPCVNVHPAILPAFKGLNAIDKAYESRVKFLGGTLHMVDEKVDNGDIIAQIVMPLHTDMTRENVLDAAFVQDVYLTLLLIDLLVKDEIKIMPNSRYELNRQLMFTDRCNPCLENEEYLQDIRELEKARKLNVLGSYKIYHSSKV